MVIQCENCNRKYKLDDSRIKPPGSDVRCSKCGHIFFVPKKEDLEIHEKSLEPEETPIFEELNEEITTEEEAVLESAAAESAGELTQGELKIQEQYDADDDMLDLPTDHDTGLEDLIDKDPAEDRTDTHREEIEHSPEEKEQSAEEDLQEAELSIEDDPALVEEENIDEIHKEVSFEDEADHVQAAEDATVSESEKAFSDTASINLSKSGPGVIAKTFHTLITIAAVTVILCASLVLLINAEILPKDTFSNLTSALSIDFGSSETANIIITEHKARWMNTVNGPIYIVSGLITNESTVPVHFVKLRSEYIAADQKQYEDIFYAGNTFSDKELKDTPIQEILQRLDQKNGDIDVNNSTKLAGLNYNIKPGESIPFFTVFPAEGRMLGLKYNLEVLDYTEATAN